MNKFTFLSTTRNKLVRVVVTWLVYAFISYRYYKLNKKYTLLKEAFKNTIGKSEYNHILQLNKIYSKNLRRLRDLNRKLKKHITGECAHLIECYENRLKLELKQYKNLSRKYAKLTASKTGVPVCHFRFQDLFENTPECVCKEDEQKNEDTSG